MSIMHAWNSILKNWECTGHLHTETAVDLHFALKSHSENALTDALKEVSNPRHARYGAYLSKEQVAELVAPHSETLELISSWLGHYGVPSSSISPSLGGNWLMVTNVPMSQANEMLGASCQIYQHVETNDTVLHTISYSLPEALHGHIKTVVPMTYFGPLLMEKIYPQTHPAADETQAKVELGELQVATGLSGCAQQIQYVTPADLRWLYKTMGYIPLAADWNRLGIVGYGKQYLSP
ncbi:Pro-kumamolisin, activation domain-containing protein [Lactarius quietus]|nr:Pro-kumamolisin, activation domain-containing protein [Lactarius quietus]